MIVLSGAALVLPDRILSPGTVTIDGGRIVEIRAGAPAAAPQTFAFHGHYIAPGFIDVHVHGSNGVDALDADPIDAVAAIAAHLPKYGVTAFCPTTVACAPAALRRTLDGVRRARANPAQHAARVLPAHLESNFVNPEYRGAQPAECLRCPASFFGERSSTRKGQSQRPADDSSFEASDILAEIERAAPDVGIVTMAPELEGANDLIAWLIARHHRVSLGHSAASYDQAIEAIRRGARHATHLFNRMPMIHHRAPGLAGAVLQSEEIAAEIICDGHHVHPGVVRAAVAAKRPSRIMAITDGTSVTGLGQGARAALGGRTITAGPHGALLEDGTLAGSTATMIGVFRMLAGVAGVSLIDAATMCSTTPARELGLVGHGVLAPGAAADLVVLDPNLEVLQTYVAGRLAYSRSAT